LQFKKCFKCLQEQPLEAFYKHHAMADGYLGKCKTCTKKDSTERRQAKLEEVRAYDRRRANLPHRVEQRRQVYEAWKVEHPNRRRAQVLLGSAVRTGKVERLPCFVCGEKAEAHHPDYDRPLDVVWLCRPHHMQAHALAANDERKEDAA
jgi:hypothetical protein